ncbi:MAG: S49 family peptidase [archaeon]
MNRARRTGRLSILLIGAGITAVVAFVAFVEYPESLHELLGLLVAIGVTVAGIRLAGNVAGSLLPDYNVAEVEVSGPIVRDSGGMLPSSPTTTPADDIVEQIERADRDGNAEVLMLKLNTPGGEVVPSDDIRRAAMAFDGPTVAYTNDLCASGGMWIASGCDELWARDASLVGSIGVRFSQTRFDEFADEYGINYERIVSGEYKDSLGAPFKTLEEREREYLQGLADDWYDEFVDRVADGRGMDETAVRDTEARVYLGEDALEMGLVDDLGDAEAVEAHVEELIGKPVSVAEFEPERRLTVRLRGVATSMAYAFGRGVGGAVSEEGSGFELR